MSDEVEGAKRASRSDLGPLQRRVQSALLRALIHPARRNAARTMREAWRRVRGAEHRVHYFHQVDDPYSHLAAQALPPLLERYAIEIVPHLTAPERGPNTPEPELLARLARRDAAAVAPHYGLEAPAADVAPEPSALRAVESLLAAARGDGPGAFAERALAAGRALWSGDPEALRSLAADRAAADDLATEAALAEGQRLRAKWGHYSGAMFYYAGEWYWGVDRLHHLEARLCALGVERDAKGPRFPRPALAMDAVARAGELTLEVFPSLRSPYTAICFERVLELAEATGVRLEIRPVLPMVMRGVPVTFAKGLYIMSDARREAECLGMPFGRILDPIGEPVRRAYALWPWAQEQGRGAALLASFLRRAFAEGVDTSTEAGLRQVVERAGLDWGKAQSQREDPRWEVELEANRRAMIDEMGQWGVPSFRLRGPEGSPDLCVWGQDRLWLVAREIQARGA